MKAILIIFFCAMPFLTHSQRKSQFTKISPDASFNIEVNEPSDLVYDPSTGNLLLVSDNGFIAEITKEGRHVRSSELIGYDTEGITLFRNDIIVVDEMTRVFSTFDRNFNRKRSVRIHYPGGRNKGFESITYLPGLSQFITMTEKSPIWVFVLNEDFAVRDEFELPIKMRDVSAITWHNDHLWILSDEDRALYQCTYPGFEVKRQFRLPIINPEGLAFDQSGNLYICSDDRERLYVFNASTLTP
jgi:uncharacterized protein YjiK